MSSLPENGQYRSVTLLAAPEELKVDSLMQQLVPGAEFKTRSVQCTIQAIITAAMIVVCLYVLLKL